MTLYTKSLIRKTKPPPSALLLDPCIPNIFLKNYINMKHRVKPIVKWYHPWHQWLPLPPSHWSETIKVPCSLTLDLYQILKLNKKNNDSSDLNWQQKMISTPPTPLKLLKTSFVTHFSRFRPILNNCSFKAIYTQNKYVKPIYSLVV